MNYGLYNNVSHQFIDSGKRFALILIIRETKGTVCGNFLYYFLDFSVNLKLKKLLEQMKLQHTTGPQENKATE